MGWQGERNGTPEHDSRSSGRSAVIPVRRGPRRSGFGPQSTSAGLSWEVEVEAIRRFCCCWSTAPTKSLLGRCCCWLRGYCCCCSNTARSMGTRRSTSYGTVWSCCCWAEKWDRTSRATIRLVGRWTSNRQIIMHTIRLGNTRNEVSVIISKLGE